MYDQDLKVVISIDIKRTFLYQFYCHQSLQHFWRWSQSFIKDLSFLKTAILAFPNNFILVLVEELLSLNINQRM